LRNSSTSELVISPRKTVAGFIAWAPVAVA
jgi:hypothetical protein